jgi:transcriptional regulator with PAS, ATPase and Fis domain
MIREKRFRLDLYYRLKGVAVTIPPLRDRRDDIEPLLSIFLDSFRQRYHKPLVEISREAVRFLRTYQWPGNVRELKNAVESAVLLSEQNRPLLPQDFLLEGPGEAALPELWKQEREAIIEVLKRTGYNRSVASKELGMSRKTLYNKMKRYSIK